MISVLPSAKQAVLDLLAAYGATYDTVRTSRGVTFVVDLGGLTAEEHPWARRLASDAASLGTDVLAITLP